jgi:hypothetical protein
VKQGSLKRLAQTYSNSLEFLIWMMRDGANAAEIASIE